jgi:iron complex outermembrane receptor protein
VPGKSPQPKWILGHTSQFGYKNVDLGFTLRANLGNYAYNAVAAGSTYSVVQGGAPRNVTTDVFKYGFVTAQPLSDLYVEDASFLRMDNLTLGFNLPRERVLRSTRVFVTAQNVFTLTKFSGLDPQSNALNGINGNQYPLSRTLTLGFNVGF